MTFQKTSVRMFALLLVLSLSDAVLAVQSEAAPDQTTSSQINYHDLDDEALIELFQSDAKQGFLDICKTKSLLSEMTKRQAFAIAAASNYIMASTECSVARKNWKEAYAHIQEWEVLEGTNPPGAEWAFRLALLADARDDALDRLESMARSEDPEQLLKISDDTVFRMVGEFGRNGDQSDVTRIYSALVQSPHLEKLQSNIRSAAAAHIVEDRLKNGNQDGIDALLLHITSPFFYTGMLAARTYGPIWKEIENRVGLNMRKLLEEDMQTQTVAYQAIPEDKKIKGQYGHALLFAGRFEEVIALAQTVDHSAEGVRNWEEDDAWLINLEVNAYDALGNTPEGDRIFDSFTILDNPENQNRWLVNFAINRAMRLVEQGRWDEGLAASGLAERLAEQTGNPFSRMLVRHLKTCALHNLGRVEVARQIISEIEVHQADSLAVAAETFLCVGDRERAADVVIKGLSDEKERSAMITALQKPTFDLFFSNSRLPTVYSELRSHPDVAKAFENVARTIPDRFIPFGNQRRQELVATTQLN